MNTFKKLIIKRATSTFVNIEYLPQVINLFQKYSKYLTDDYADSASVDNIIELIENTKGFFWVVLSKSGEFAGFAFLENWVGNFVTKHSAEVTTCINKKYWGSFTRECAKKFIKYCFKKYGLKKLKATVFPDNKMVIGMLKANGFKKEATLKSETIRNGILQDVDIYSIIRGE